MFQLLPCSQCQRTFSVRQELSDAALLQCPNCGHQFRLGELLDTLYAPWKILEDPLDNLSQNRVRASSLANDNTAVDLLGSGEPLSEETQLAIEHRVEQVEEGLQLTATNSTSQRVDWSDFKPGTHDNHARRRTKSSGGLWSTLQVILGGAAAIPVSLLLIWHVLGKDVAGAGPQVARYLPWIVPKQFHGRSGTQTPPPRSRVERAAASANGTRSVEDNAASTEVGFRESLTEPAFSVSPSLGEMPNSEVNATTAPQEPSLSNPKDAQPTTQPAEDSAKSNAPSESPTKPTTNGERPPEAPLLEFIQSVQKTKQRVADWSNAAQDVNDTAANETQTAAARLILTELAGLGEAYAKLPPGSGSTAALQSLIKDLGRLLKRQTALVEKLRLLSEDQWATQTPQAAQGLALVGTIEDAQEKEDQWLVRLASPQQPKVASPAVVIAQQLSPRPMAGEKRLLIGNFEADTRASSPSQTETLDEQAAKLKFKVSFIIAL